MSRPLVIIHMTDYYDAGIGGGKWKDRFMTTAQTMAQGLIQYLKWPGDVPRFGGPQAKVLGEFSVYTYDEEATYRLRREMEKMRPADRWAKVNTNSYRSKMDKTFLATLRDTIMRTTGAD